MWILKSNPVKPADVFFAKITANLVIGIPSIIIAALVSWFTVSMSVKQGAMIFILPTIVQVFTALWGFSANLWFPRFDWINATTVIKQSMGSLVGLLGSLALIAVLVFAYLILFKNIISVDDYLIACTAFFIILCTALAAHIKTTGKSLFEKM
jgi:hypothetical protein